MLFEDTGGADFEPAPTGMHLARCVRIIDLGTHEDDYYGKDKHEVFFMWELPEEIKTYTIKAKDNQPEREVTEPFSASKFYTMSLAERAWLRKDLESWRSKPFTEDELKGFDPKAILGAPCMINIIHEPKKRGKGVNTVITAITPVPKSLVEGMKPAVHELIYFSLRDFDKAAFDKVSKGLQAKIKRSQEWAKMEQQASAGGFGALEEEVSAAEMAASDTSPMDDGFDDIPF